MPAREFKDGGGREWRVWDVNPDDLSPRTTDEDYLAHLYYTGWLVFESKEGDDKRRLYPIPRDWHELSEDKLEGLLQKAEVVPRRKVRDVPRHETPDVTDLSVVRTFRYPTGRYWTVSLIMHPEGGGPPVLQFAAGSRHIDLESWPKDWADYPDEELVNLLRRAAPREKAQASLSPGTPQRRWDDSVSR